MSGAHVDMQKRVRTWAPRRADIAAWATAALGRRARNREVAVRVVGRAESRKLNSQYRGKDYATNVLSFPAPPFPEVRGFARPGTARPRAPAAPRGRAPNRRAFRAAAGMPRLPLGDLVICPQVLASEARAQKKSVRAHWAHLVVHGTLHLIGYDHERGARAAARMERREIAVLRSLGFTNPYRSPP